MEIIDNSFAGHKNYHYKFSNGVVLSVAFGTGAYCSPRDYRISLEDYQAVEIAFMRDGNFISHEEAGLKMLPLNSRGDDVYAYVPVPVVKAAIELLKQQEQGSN